MHYVMMDIFGDHQKFQVPLFLRNQWGIDLLLYNDDNIFKSLLLSRLNILDLISYH